MSNEEVLGVMVTKISWIIRFRKRQLKYRGNIMSNEVLENLTHRGYSDGKRDKIK